MNEEFYKKLTNLSLADKEISQSDAESILNNPGIQLLELLNASFRVRSHYFNKDVTVHIINNAQNGFCPEDCHYCAQAKSSKSSIEEYSLKSDEEFMKEAKNAYEKGAHRYCMVFAGRGPSTSRVEKLAALIKKIKSNYPIEICVSAGLLNEDKAKILSDAGLDRLNHNLNTSNNNYSNICTTHTYDDRIKTLQAAKNAGLQLCSGIIVGMKETHQDIISVARELRSLNAESIPVNFLIPIEGTTIDKKSHLTPEFCLRVLCLFRFINPRSEIRIAAGREIHLRSLEALALFPANSLFLDGYLNTKGSERLKTLHMIKDAGFNVKSSIPLDELIGNEQKTSVHNQHDSISKLLLKNISDLRPHLVSPPHNSN